MTIFWPSASGLKTTVDAIRAVIGRNIYIITPSSGIPCSGCSLNPITNMSTNPFCPTCSGYYWINTETSNIVQAHVTDGTFIDKPWRVAGGNIDKGDVTIQIEYTSTNVTLINTAKYFTVDSKKYFRDRVSYRGVPDINRIVVTLKEQES